MDLRAIRLKLQIAPAARDQRARGLPRRRARCAHARLVPLECDGELRGRDAAHASGRWLPRAPHRPRAISPRPFPKSPPRRSRRILRGVWDNLGRVGAEFAHIDRLWDYDRLPGTGRIMRLRRQPSRSRSAAARRRQAGAGVRRASRATGSCRRVAARMYGLDTTVLYRRPNIGAAADAVVQIARRLHGHADADHHGRAGEARRCARRGARTSACWSTSTTGRGVDVTFFGRKTLGQSADRAARPPHRLPDPRHPRGAPARRAIAASASPRRSTPVRDADGKIDVEGTMQVITGVIEGWVREHPEQWLWLHRRWRDG